MGKVLAWVLVLAMAGGGVANASGKKPASKLAAWDALQRLQPGSEIDVLAVDSAGPERCLVSSVDDGALTCLREYPANHARLVFPRGAVLEVRLRELAPNRHIGLWIAAIVSVGLEVAACVGSGVLGGVVVGAMISVGWGVALNPLPQPFWLPPPPPPQPRMRWRLVYRSMTP
jgi:hypothetical protein